MRRVKKEETAVKLSRKMLSDARVIAKGKRIRLLCAVPRVERYTILPMARAWQNGNEFRIQDLFIHIFTLKDTPQIEYL